MGKEGAGCGSREAAAYGGPGAPSIFIGEISKQVEKLRLMDKFHIIKLDDGTRHEMNEAQDTSFHDRGSDKKNAQLIAQEAGPVPH